MALVGLTRATQFLRIHQLSKTFFSFLTEKCIKNASPSLSFQIPRINHYCTDTKDKKPADVPKKSAAPHATEESKKRKGMTSPQITLIDFEDDVKATTLEIAEKLAKRRNLKLVKIIDFDTKSERPVFKLMTTAQFFEEESKSKERKRHEKQSGIKDVKLFIVSSKIGDNDLAIKVKQMSKALTKRHPIRVCISQDGNPSRADEIAKLVEEELEEFYSTKENTKKFTTLKLLLKPKMENQNEDTNKKGKEKIEESGKVEVKAN